MELTEARAVAESAGVLTLDIGYTDGTDVLVQPIPEQIEFDDTALIVHDDGTMTREPADAGQFDSWAEVGVNDALTASAPSQARAPKGTPIGGEWIETPGGMLDTIKTRAPAGVQETVRNQGGASIDPLTGLQPTDGYQVGVKGYTKIVPEDEFFGPSGADTLVSWIDEHQEQLSQPGGHIGLWHDTETGNVVFDVSMNVKDKDEAIRMGQEGDQVSIWDNVAGDEIQTGGTGEGLRSSADPQAGPYRMDDHDHDAGPPSVRRTPPGLGRVGRGSQARLRAGDDRRSATRRVAYVAADQVRAPKGTPQGGQWIDTPGGMARQLRGVAIAADNLGKPTHDPQSLDDMDNDYRTLVSEVNPGYLEDPNNPAYNQNCQRVSMAMEMRARGFDSAGNGFDGTRDDNIAIEDCWNDPQTGSVRLFGDEFPPSQARKVMSQYPPGSRFLVGGWSESEQYGHMWNAEVQADGTILEVDGQGGSRMNDNIMDFFDGVQWMRVDDLSPTENMMGGMAPMVTTPDNQFYPGSRLISAGEPIDPIEAGTIAGYEVIDVRDLGSEYHLIQANPVHKFSDSLLVMDKATGEVGYVSRFTHPSVQTVPEETTP